LLVVYDSRTGNVQRFVDRFQRQATAPIRFLRIQPSLVVHEPYILLTYTTGFGAVPESVEQFLKRCSSFLIGVAASGNRNWGYMFAKSADIISSQYHVPIVHKFELSGTNTDIKIFEERVQEIYEAYRTQQHDHAT